MAKVTVLQMDMDTLDDGQEINDSIVDFSMMYAIYAMDQEVKNSHVFSSFFFTKLSEGIKNGDHFVLPSAEERHERACSFIRKVDLFKMDFVFIPVCRSGHWFLALVYNLPLLHSERVPIFMIDSIVWGSEDSLYCTPSSREQEAELIRR
ncbi:sentrin-specific protease 7-like [Montipora foliosa]|uniref:sentrin-specific protease 7-like n=1 Tax=Montipora foliosa TaxID=591990 RepID=UPI0035F155DE